MNNPRCVAALLRRPISCLATIAGTLIYPGDPLSDTIPAGILEDGWMTYAGKERTAIGDSNVNQSAISGSDCLVIIDTAFNRNCSHYSNRYYRTVAVSNVQTNLGASFDSSISEHSNTPFLTDAERRYLAALPPIRTSLIVRFLPFRYLDRFRQITGILPEYLQYLSQRLGLRFVQRGEASPGAEGAALVDARTDLIVYVLPLDTKGVLSGATRAVETFPVIIAGRRDAAPLNDIAQLGGARIAVVERSQNLEMLRERAPQAVTVMTASLERALTLVHERRADVAIGNLAAIDYLLQRGFGDDIKVLGMTGYQQAIGFQLRRDLDPLIPILNRTLDDMPESQRMAIRNRHLSTSYELGLRWRDVYARAAPFAVAIVLGGIVLGIAHAWLRKEVGRRKRSEEALQTQLRFRTLLDMVPIPIAIHDWHGAYRRQRGRPRRDESRQARRDRQDAGRVRPRHRARVPASRRALRRRADRLCRCARRAVARLVLVLASTVQGRAGRDRGHGRRDRRPDRTDGRAGADACGRRV